MPEQLQHEQKPPVCEQGVLFSQCSNNDFSMILAMKIERIKVNAKMTMKMQVYKITDILEVTSELEIYD